MIYIGGFLLLVVIWFLWEIVHAEPFPDDEEYALRHKNDNKEETHV